jgi:hypothetical protein
MNTDAAYPNVAGNLLVQWSSLAATDVTFIVEVDFKFYRRFPFYSLTLKAELPTAVNLTIAQPLYQPKSELCSKTVTAHSVLVSDSSDDE